MRARTWIIALAGLCVVLAAGWYNTWMEGIPQAPMPSRSTNAPPRVVKTNVVVRHANFVWSQLESTNYYIYVNNLRELGCPEGTIRNIVISEINLLYLRRWNSEILLPEQAWWRSTPDIELANGAVEKIRTLELDRQALLKKLLGDDWQQSGNAQLPAVESPLLTELLGPGWQTADSVSSTISASCVLLTGPVLGDLSAATKQAVYDIAGAARQKVQQYRQSQLLESGRVDPAEVARLQLEERNQLSGVLDSAQLQEFLLRYSQTAGRIRDQMASLNLGPEQFRAVFVAVDPIVSQPRYYYAGGDPDQLQTKQQLQAQADAAIKLALGDTTYATYKLNQDPVYLASSAAARQIGVPTEAILPLYEINRATQAEMNRIRNDMTMTDEEKMEDLATTQVQQQQTVEKLLGPEGFQRWLQAQGQSQTAQPQQAAATPQNGSPVTPQ